MDEATLPLIKVVGISASGKSTLVAHLRNAGYNARPVSQEHSDVANLWQQFDRTSLLIYLDVSLEAQRQRRPDVTWDAKYLQTEHKRLTHARDHADLKINTSALTPDTVWHITQAFVEQQQVRHADYPLPPLTATGSALRPVETPPEPPPPGPDKRRGKKRKRPPG